MDTVNPKCTTKITKNGITNKPTKQKTWNHRKQMRQRENKQTVDLNPTILIILNVNGLNIPVKRQRLSDLWLK